MKPNRVTPLRELMLITTCLIVLAGCQPRETPTAAPAPAGPTAAATNSAEPAAPTPQPEQRGPNESYYTVREKLDEGGSFYLYADVEGVIRGVLAEIENLLNALEVPPEGDQIFQAVQAEIERAGLYQLEDIGMSSVREDNQYLNKMFLSLPQGREGIFSMLGGEPHPFETLSYAPEDTLLFGTQEFDQAAALAYIREAIAHIGGEKASQTFEDQLDTIRVQTGIDLPAVLQSLNGRLTVVGTLDESRQLAELQPGMAIPLPKLVMMAGTHDATLYDSLRALLQNKMGHVEETTTGGLKMTALPVPPEVGFSPVIARDAGHFYLATDPEYLARVRSAPQSAGGLESSPEFQELARGLPTEGNSMLFISKRLYDEYYRLAMAGAEHASPMPLAFGPWLTGLNRRESGSLSVRVNQPDGILYVGRSSRGAQSMLTAVGFVPVGVLAAIAIPNFMEAQQRSRVSMVRADHRSMATALEAYNIDWNSYPPQGELYRLTTPIAYLTGLFKDPFQPEGGTFYYYPNPEGQTGELQWIIWSPGPDEYPDLTPENLPLLVKSGLGGSDWSLAAFMYDPTNGTVSSGDIWRSSQ